MLAFPDTHRHHGTAYHALRRHLGRCSALFTCVIQLLLTTLQLNEAVWQHFTNIPGRAFWPALCARILRRTLSSHGQQPRGAFHECGQSARLTKTGSRLGGCPGGILVKSPLACRDIDGICGQNGIGANYADVPQCLTHFGTPPSRSLASIFAQYCRSICVVLIGTVVGG